MRRTDQALSALQSATPNFALQGSFYSTTPRDIKKSLQHTLISSATLPTAMSATDATAHTDHDDQLEARREAKPRTLLETRLNLKQQIDALVATHQNDQPPPFTSPELIIMAIIVSKNEFCNKHEILDWVEDTFPYWAKLARNGETTGNEDHAAFRPGDDAVHYMEQEFLDTLRAHELPLNQNSSHYAVRTDAAQIFLRRWLDPPRKGTFHFLDLPAELRNRIYELVLIFPNSRIELRRGIGSHGPIDLFATERDTAGTGTEGQHPILKPNEILNIALVNRQLAKETIPIFYGANQLSFSQGSAIASFVKITSPRRLRLIKQIEISVDVYRTYQPVHWREPDQEMGSTIEALSKAIPSLPTLTFKINGTRWQYDSRLEPRMGFIASQWSSFDKYSSLRAITKLAVQTKKCIILFNYEHQARHEYMKAIQEPVVEELKRLKGEAGSVRVTDADGRCVVVEEGDKQA
ncbi:hypothetical protein M409DRAFT_61017 [Zasmidium cellare ATCC 36951]|uniref:F-box domain-containing protein n=1 Tax=Zasmidium cellare ATCC 36951 TaxID=1080233 RepID=A0A6A6BWI0_ZASCE|nr:uncharacterized protein M409DRAFT_61017 [Zasmidium cellare ATCC 36951]KAF2159194.1 hypothetical protein M409DRAFT_61017 [Zasmidium cellare ATCC 36951]